MKENIQLLQTHRFTFISYCKNSRLTIFHRENNKPSTIRSDGEKYYTRNGRFCRDFGPVFIDSRGKEYYYRKGKLVEDEGIS
jgi:hypothetical protein